VTIALAIREAADALAGCSDTPRLDAELLMAHILGVSRSDLLIHHMKQSPPPPGFASLIVRRMRHEPVAYILGEQEFYGLSFRVTPDVLIPRGDSEVLVEAALKARPDAKRVLDCGTGSGALLLAVLHELPEAEGVGIDCSFPAVFVAIDNAERVGVNKPPDPDAIKQFIEGLKRAGANTETGTLAYVPEGRASFKCLDWRKRSWRKYLGKFDLILANPPYVETDAELAASVREHEPAGALFAGADGLDDYRVLVPQLPALLAPDGVALIEIGATQADAVSAIANSAGLGATLHHDLAGRPRVLECKLALGNRAPSG
jgi:release factor glutamine methyltransferase